MFLQKGKRKLSISWAVFSIIICIILLKIIIMYTIFNINETEFTHILNHKDSFIIIFKAIKSDFIVFLSLILLEFSFLKFKTKFLKYLFASSIIIIATLYIIDSVIIYSGTRLFMTDAIKYVASMPISAVLVIITTLWLLFLLYSFLVKKNKEISRNKAIFIILGFFIFYIFPIHISTYYMKEDLLSSNMYTTNMHIRYIKDYDNKYQLKQDYDNRFIETKWKSKDKNIILIVDESLSAVDSYRTSWVKHYLTGFDEISKDGILYRNMIANGNATDAGLTAILKWVEPIPFSLSIDYYSLYKSPTTNLARFFDNKWYETNFFTTWPWDFLDKEGFLKDLGYQNIIDAKKYQWLPTYAFWSVPDSYLYKESLDYIKNKQETDEKYFLTMMTISSHLPYDTPYGKTKESMYRYTDDLLIQFYKDLKQTDFFDNGLLIVVWDHRKMTPLESGEYDKYADSAYNRIACLVIWNDIKPDIDENIYQQTDIFYSIKDMFGDSIKLIDNYNNIFDKEIRRDYALAPSFADKENMVIIQKNYKWLIYENLTLNSEKTKFKRKYNNIENPEEIIEYINQLRSYQMFLQKSILTKFKEKLVWYKNIIKEHISE